MASAEVVTIDLEGMGDGEPVRLLWSRGAAEALAEGEAGTVGDSAWRLEGEPDWERAEGLRLIWALFEDGRALAVAALRSRGAPGHDRDSMGHHLTDEEGPMTLTEVLLSTEYDAAGLPARIGLELWAEPDSPPLRVAADREGEVAVSWDGARREAARMSFRLDGTGGIGEYELLRPA